jgi:dephospho-CoA kinase
MALVIALTGGIGSGKTSVADALAEMGAAIVDTDAIAHELTARGKAGAREIARVFGNDYLNSDGALDRPRMRDLVFKDTEAKHKLEAILHPMIRTEVRARIDAAAANGDAPYTVIVVPLLIETGAYRDLSQRILVVDCDEAQQVKRVMQRSGLTADAVRAIMAQQATREERLRHADDIVRNDGDIAALHAAVEALHQRYMALARATAA